MDSFKPIVDFFKGVIDDIMKGDWSGAFKRISDAAAVAWRDIKIAFPLLGEIESLVNKIQNGNWKGAFLQIAVAAKGAWETLIRSVPFFAGVNEFIKKIQNADWKGAWDVVAKGAIDALKGVFGVFNVENFITQLQSIPAKLKAAMNVPGATVFSVIDAMIPTDVKNFAVWAGTMITNAITALNKALNEKLTFISTTFIDPFIASLFSPSTWVVGLLKQTDALLGIGKFIFDAFMNSIFPKDQKAAAALVLTQAQNLLNIWNGIVDWLTINLPTATKAATAFVGKITTAISTAFTVANFTTSVTNMIAAFSKAVINVGKNLILIGNGVVKAIIKGMTEMFSADNLAKVVRSIISGLSKAVSDSVKSIAQIGFRIGKAIWDGLSQALNPIRNLIPSGSILDRALKGEKFNPKTGATGFHGITTGPMLIGERGAERFDITPMNDMINRKDKSSSGGTPSTIIVYSVLDGRIVAESVAKQISVNQAVYR
jgi:hypothetical protein